MFGGMCPESNATAADWQSAALYSNSMLRFSPTTSSSKTSYTLGTTTSRGPPVAEAGFTITGLSPSYSNATGVETQQQSFVLVGGHTQTAFINMSQVAVWSLPEETWSFITVDSPSSSNPNTELAIKSAVTAVDSRSGHSAVLSQDGSSIIVYGGWVGDVNTAADPQLVILELGTGYGGTGDWKWTVPASQPSGTGMFGHGAVMLPGNIMMILGGYNISTSSTAKRAAAVGNQAMFYNATSGNWISQYVNPAYTTFLNQQAASQSASRSNATKLGLGLGIGLGLAVVIAAIVLCCWYSARLKKRREREREQDVRALSNSVSGFYSNPNREMSQSGGGVFPWANRGWNGGQDSNSAVDGYVNLQTNAHSGLEPVPLPPKQIQRKPLHSRSARGGYQAAASFDFNTGTGHGRANSLGTAGAIHPIYEADEEDQGHESDGVGIALGEPSTLNIDTNRYSDPFKDSHAVSHSSQARRDVNTHGIFINEPESPAASREREIQEWVTDWAAADLLLQAQTRIHSHTGRISPTRRAQLVAAATTASSVSAEEDSGRTESNLSERTERSLTVSGSGLSRSGSSSQGRSRSNSLRGFITGINPFASGAASTAGTSTVMSPVFDGQGPRSYVPPRSAGSSSSKSFNTARTSFPALQAEGETLLPRPIDDISSGEASPVRSQHDTTQPHHYVPTPGSPSKSKPSAIALGKRRGQAGWLGSLRRVFASEDTSTSTSGDISPEHLGFGNGSRDGSSVRVDQTGSLPRRTVSAGATLWRRKQGKSDWDDSVDVFTSGPSNRAHTFTGDLATPGLRELGGRRNQEEDEEWDIERAVQNRVVQVMFTVPKEKLRVVNHDFDEGSTGTRSAGSSLRSKKGSLKRKGSLKGVFMPPPPVPMEMSVEANASSEALLAQKSREELYREGEREEEVSKLAVSVAQQQEQDQRRRVDKGKGKEIERDVDVDRDIDGQSLASGRSSPGRRKHTKVLEMVDKMEGRNSPERV